MADVEFRVKTLIITFTVVIICLLGEIRTDEVCNSTHLLCTVTKLCRSNTLKCDNYDNCGDNTDEQNCAYPPVDRSKAILFTINNQDQGIEFPSAIVRLYGNPDDYTWQLENSSFNGTLPYLGGHLLFKNYDYIHALAVNYSTRTVYFTDNYNGRVHYAQFVDTVDTSGFFYETPPISKKMNGIAFDWASNNLYWTDAEQNWIVMMPISSNSGRVWKAVVTNLSAPQDVVVNPLTAHLFWSDGNGTSAKIERSDLSGNNRVVLLNSTQGLVAPTTLVVDFTSQRLYWLDAAANTLGAVNFDGSNMTIWNRSEFVNFTGMTVNRNFLCFGDSFDRIVHIYDKLTVTPITSHVITRRTPGHVTDMVTFSADMQPSASSPCSSNNGGCAQLCLPTSQTSRVCDCIDGSFLNADGITCAIRPFPAATRFLLVADFCQNNVYQVLPDTGEMRALLAPSSAIWPVALVYDSSKNVVYMTCKEYRNNENVFRIRKKMLNGNNDLVVYISSSGSTEMMGLALDSTRGLLYYTDRGTGVIAEIRTDGSDRREIFNNAAEKPYAIIVNATTRRLYWTDCSIIPTIQTSRVDGEDRQTLVSGTAGSCFTGLAVDFKVGVMYWTVDKPPAVMQSALDGARLRALMNDSLGTYSAIALTDNYLYISDKSRRNIIKLDLATSGVVNQPPSVFSCAHDVKYCVSIPAETTGTSTTQAATTTTTATINDSATASIVPLVVGVVVGVGGFLVVVIIAVVCVLVCLLAKKNRRNDANRNTAMSSLDNPAFVHDYSGVYSDIQPGGGYEELRAKKVDSGYERPADSYLPPKPLTVDGNRATMHPIDEDYRNLQSLSDQLQQSKFVGDRGTLHPDGENYLHVAGVDSGRYVLSE